MTSFDWELCGGELACYVVHRASLDLANHNLDIHDAISVLRRMVGFAWDMACMRAVGANRLPAVPQRAVINPHTKRPARALKLRQHRIWRAPPGLMVDEPRKWWNLIAKAGLSGRAPS